MSFWSFGPILAWYRFPAAEEFVVIFEIFFIQWRAKSSLQVKDLDCRQANSAPGLFYYEDLLLY